MKFIPQHFLPAVTKEPGLISVEDAARIANELLDEHIKTLPVVYGCPCSDTPPGDWWRTFSKAESDTHTARLICIEEIEKKPCEHEPRYDSMSVLWNCKHCGVMLKPKWEAVDE